MRQVQRDLEVETRGRGLIDMTAAIASFVAECEASEGLLTIFCRHTSASLVIQENADRDVLRDLESFLSRIAPEDEERYRHRTEGPDDMPAHIRAALTNSSLAIPVRDGELALGIWQAVYLWEHRSQPQRRTLALHFLGT